MTSLRRQRKRVETLLAKAGELGADTTSREGDGAGAGVFAVGAAAALVAADRAGETATLRTEVEGLIAAAQASKATIEDGLDELRALGYRELPNGVWINPAGKAVKRGRRRR